MKPGSTRVAVTIEAVANGAVTRYHEAHSCELEEMQKAVGGYLQAVHISPDRLLALEAMTGCPPLPKNMLMYVNEEGKLKGLAHNNLASVVAGHPINGNVIVIEVKPEDYG